MDVRQIAYVKPVSGRLAYEGRYRTDDTIELIILFLFFQRCHPVWRAAAEQRRLLQTVVEKAAWKGGALQTARFEPFEILRHSNQESYRKKKKKAGSGREMGIWLPTKPGIK